MNPQYTHTGGEALAKNALTSVHFKSKLYVTSKQHILVWPDRTGVFFGLYNELRDGVYSISWKWGSNGVSGVQHYLPFYSIMTE